MAKVDDGSSRRSLKACCLVSEMLEEMGLDSIKAREIRRQTLLGLMTFCQWQLARMDDATAPSAASAEPRKTKGRRVRVV
jgi:hypothetical protein